MLCDCTWIWKPFVASNHLCHLLFSKPIWPQYGHNRAAARSCVHWSLLRSCSRPHAETNVVLMSLFNSCSKKVNYRRAEKYQGGHSRATPKTMFEPRLVMLALYRQPQMPMKSESTQEAIKRNLSWDCFVTQLTECFIIWVTRKGSYQWE